MDKLRRSESRRAARTVAARGLASRDVAAGSSARWSRVRETKDTMRGRQRGLTRTGEAVSKVIR